MNRSLLWLTVGAWLWIYVPAWAERPDTDYRGFTGTISAGQVTPTPDMWFYEQYMHQYLDPKMTVRRNAESRALQREARLAAIRWFGLSNSRPRASSDPIHGDYSPYWASNNNWYPMRWTGLGPVWTFVEPTPTSPRP